jgi:nickel/cobalt transporter (NicO) family protein
MMGTTLRRWWAIIAIALLVCATWMTSVAPAAAQSAPIATPSSGSTPPLAASRSPFAPKSDAAAVAQPPSGPLAGFYAWIAHQMRWFNQTLATALRDIKAGNIWAASLTLIAFSFAYGILHAAGPGHGKAIVSSYMLADGQTVRRGIQLAFLSSAVQAVSAIAIFSVIVLILSGARTQIVATEAFLERASWAIVAAFGLYLLVRQIRALWSGRPAHDHAHHAHDRHAHAPHAHHHHEHANAGHRHHDHAHPNHVHHHHGHAHTKTAQSHDHHDHKHHDHTHAPGEACDTCGHAHMPTADALQGAWSWRRASGMALAIGMRPCTGAIGVLFLANALGLLWAGIASTLVMSLGTAITVSALAALTVSSRELATRLAGAGDASWASKAQTAIGLAGAAAVFVLGASFFWYSLSNPTAF